jgi:hypothetical protein
VTALINPATGAALANIPDASAADLAAPAARDSFRPA